MATTPLTNGSATLKKKNGFWARQSELPPTAVQGGFDVLLGIVTPLLCLFFDPVFSGDLLGSSLLNSFRMFAYIEVGTGIAALGIYLLTRRASALLAGILSSGAIFAFGLGIFIFPLTFWGLFFLFGIFGLTPFFTGFVFLRNA